MRVLGITFVGTATAQRPEMVRFLQEVLNLSRRSAPDVEADLFALADGSTFAIASPEGMGNTERSIGFLVSDLDEARETLQVAGIASTDIATNSLWRYAHFVAPDGQLYEIVESREQAESAT